MAADRAAVKLSREICSQREDNLKSGYLSARTAVVSSLGSSQVALAEEYSSSAL